VSDEGEPWNQGLASLQTPPIDSAKEGGVAQMCYPTGSGLISSPGQRALRHLHLLSLPGLFSLQAAWAWGSWTLSDWAWAWGSHQQLYRVAAVWALGGGELFTGGPKAPGPLYWGCRDTLEPEPEPEAPYPGGSRPGPSFV